MLLSSYNTCTTSTNLKRSVEQRLEALSETPLDLKEVTDVLECEVMWSGYRDMIEQVQTCQCKS